MGVLSRRFRERLNARGRPLLLDAAMGTELQRRDANTTLPLWSARPLLEDPELVWTIHCEEVSAGAEILTANTFRTHARTLGRAGLQSRAAEMTALAVRLAHQAASTSRGGEPRTGSRGGEPRTGSRGGEPRTGSRGGEPRKEAHRNVFVAGSLAPLEDCYRPDLAPPTPELEREHAAQAGLLAEAGVDLILAETHNSVREAAAAVRAAKATGLPVVVSLVTDGAGRLLSGETVEAAAAALGALEPDAIGVNCVPAARLAGDLARLSASARERPLAAYGNLGLPADGRGWAFTEELSPEAYATEARRWLELGARIVGGCCGATPAHTRAMRKMLDEGNSPFPPGGGRGSG